MILVTASVDYRVTLHITFAASWVYYNESEKDTVLTGLLAIFMLVRSLKFSFY